MKGFPSLYFNPRRYIQRTCSTLNLKKHADRQRQKKREREREGEGERERASDLAHSGRKRAVVGIARGHQGAQRANCELHII